MAQSGCATDVVFYDGTCGFCHWSVQVLLRCDRDGTRFRYAPLGGETFRALIRATELPTLPDSLVVVTEDGRRLFRSTAVLHLMRRCGAWRRVLAWFLWWLPAFLRDWLYDRFAAVRHRLFPQPETTCPLLPPELRSRFDP